MGVRQFDSAMIERILHGDLVVLNGCGWTLLKWNWKWMVVLSGDSFLIIKVYVINQLTSTWTCKNNSIAVKMSSIAIEITKVITKSKFMNVNHIQLSINILDDRDTHTTLLKISKRELYNPFDVIRSFFGLLFIQS